MSGTTDLIRGPAPLAGRLIHSNQEYITETIFSLWMLVRRVDWVSRIKRCKRNFSLHHEDVAMPSLKLDAQRQDPIESPEVKKPLRYENLDESLSEWELARMTSKTWSMEQD